MPIPLEDIHKVQQLCLELDNDIRWIITAISDNDMRLAEVIGLTINMQSTLMKGCHSSGSQSISGGV